MKYHCNLLRISIITFALFFSINPIASQDANRLKIARALEKSGCYKEALDIYKKFYSEGNNSHQVVSGIKKSYLELQRYEDLIEFLNTLLTRYPDRTNYKIDLGAAYYLSDNKEQGLAIWEDVYNSQPSNSMNYRLVGNAMIKVRLYDEAIRVYKKAIRNTKNQEMLYRDIAMLYKSQLDYKHAVENYLLYYNYYKKQFKYVRSQLISMTKDEDAVDRIILSIEDFKRNHSTDAAIEELSAEMYIKKKDFKHAFSIYQQLHERNKKQNYLMRFAREAEANSAYSYAILAYQTILASKVPNQNRANLNFNLARNYYYLGGQLAKQGDNENGQIKVNKAIHLLDGVIGDKTSIQFTFRSIEFKADIYRSFYNDIDKAIGLYESIVSARGNIKATDQVRIKLGDSYLLKNDLQNAQYYYSNIFGRDYRALAKFNSGEINYFKGQFRLAKTQYESLLSKVSSKDSLANNILDRIILIDQYVNDSTSLSRFAAAELLQRQQKQSQAAKEFTALLFLNNDLSLLAGINAAEIYIHLDKLDSGEKVLNTIIDNYADDVKIDRAFFLAGELYGKKEDYTLALKNYKKILTDFPSSFYLEQARGKARVIASKIEGMKLP